MRFTIDKEQFLKGLLIAGRGIGAKNANPLLLCFKMEMTSIGLEITASNGDVTVFTRVPLKLNEKFLKDKDDASRFVVESVEIIDSLPRDENVAGEIKITILDTEEEYSYSIWGMKSFIVKDVQEDKVDYYLNDDLANGIAEFAFKGGDIYYVASRVGDSLSIHEVDSLTYVSTPWIIFYCKSINCLSSCEKGGQWYLGWCRQCPYNNGQCSQESILPIVLEVIGLVLAAITIILML